MNQNQCRDELMKHIGAVGTIVTVNMRELFGKKFKGDDDEGIQYGMVHSYSMCTRGTEMASWVSRQTDIPIINGFEATRQPGENYTLISVSMYNHHLQEEQREILIPIICTQTIKTVIKRAFFQFKDKFIVADTDSDTREGIVYELVKIRRRVLSKFSRIPIDARGKFILEIELYNEENSRTIVCPITQLKNLDFA